MFFNHLNFTLTILSPGNLNCMKKFESGSFCKGAKFLECRIILLDRPENLNFAPSFGYATIFLRGRLEHGKSDALWVIIDQCPH